MSLRSAKLLALSFVVLLISFIQAIFAETSIATCAIAALCSVWFHP